MSGEAIFFYYFAGMSIITAIMTVGLRNPIYCALSLLAMFGHVAGLFVLLSAEFIAVIQIIVYAGAILVMYIVVVMVFNVKSEERFFHYRYPILAAVGLVILAELFLAMNRSRFLGVGTPVPSAAAASHQGGNTEAIGLLFYTVYLYPFEVVGLIFLVGFIAVMILAKPVKGEDTPA